MEQRIVTVLLLVAATLGFTGCATVKRTAVNQLGDALAAGGTTFAADNDPELIKSAAPFSLKLMESLLAESPRHRGLLLAAAGGFTQYAYAYVQQEAEELATVDAAAALAARLRARRLYLRARDYALRGLEAAHPGFLATLRAEPSAAAAHLGPADVGFAYWAAVSWAAAIAILKNDAALIGDLPLVDTLAGRALVLDEAWDHGASHTFFISYELTRPGGTAAGARAHFARVRELTSGAQAGPFVALAQSVAVGEQNRAEFLSLLQAALAIDPDARPEWRLANLMMQHRARWLLAHVDDYIASNE